MFLAISFPVFAQSPPIDTEVIKAAIRPLVGDTIVYGDICGSGPWLEINEVFNKLTFESRTQEFPDEAINLTDSERAYLLHQIYNAENFKWPDSLFYNSKRIPSKDLFRYSAIKQRDIYIKINEAIEENDWDTYDKLQHVYFWDYEFSKPVYIRNGTVCLLYYAKLCCGNGGSDGLFFFKKINGQWKKWIILRQGDY